MPDQLPRRAVLAAAGTAAATAVAPTAAARYTTRMVVPPARSFVGEEGYSGYFLHVGSESTGELEADSLSGCGFGDWPPDDLAYFNGRLIDRIDQDAREIETQIYVPATAGISPGTLWVVNREVTCPDEYVGLSVEQIGAAVVVGSSDADEGGGTTSASDSPTDGGGPGFGPLAALAGVAAGVAGYARRRDDD